VTNWRVNETSVADLQRSGFVVHHGQGRRGNHVDVGYGIEGVDRLAQALDREGVGKSGKHRTQSSADVVGERAGRILLLHVPADAEFELVRQSDFGNRRLDQDLLRHHVERADEPHDPAVIGRGRLNENGVLAFIEADPDAGILVGGRRARKRRAGSAGRRVLPSPDLWRTAAR